jgi:hypothetical protein
MSTDERHLLASQVFAYLRGELDEADRRRFEGLLLADERVSHFVSQVSDMLGAARSQEPTTWTDTPADEIFASVETRLAQEGPQANVSVGTVTLSGGVMPRSAPASPLAGSDGAGSQGVRSTEDALFASILTRVATSEAYAATQPLDRETRAGAEAAGRTVVELGSATMIRELSALDSAAAGSTRTLLFGSTRELIEPAGPIRAAVKVVSEVDDELDRADLDRSPNRWRLGLAALAAVVLAGVMALVWNAQQEPAGAGERPVQLAGAEDSGATGAGADVAPVPSQMTVEQALAGAVQQPTGRESVRVFASDGAEWRIGSDEEGTLLELTMGALAVEFLPLAGEPPLRVRTPEYEVRVVGTVFYASTGLEGPEVGVATGAVEVTVEGESAGRLSTGEVYDRQTGERSTEEQFEWLEGRVDVAGHEAALRERAAAAGSVAAVAPGRQPERTRSPGREPERVREPVRGAPEAALEDATTGSAEVPAPVDLRARARALAAAGDWRAAAAAWERVLAQVPASSGEEATIRLDLARIYLRQLESPLQATGHLRSFVQRFPNDVATPSVLQELCRISRERGWVEPLCDRVE